MFRGGLVFLKVHFFWWGVDFYLLGGVGGVSDAFIGRSIDEGYKRESCDSVLFV